MPEDACLMLRQVSERIVVIFLFLFFDGLGILRIKLRKRRSDLVLSTLHEYWCLAECSLLLIACDYILSRLVARAVRDLLLASPYDRHLDLRRTRAGTSDGLGVEFSRVARGLLVVESFLTVLGSGVGCEVGMAVSSRPKGDRVRQITVSKTRESRAKSRDAVVKK